ncbi:hypothetical protein B0T19DRAFT_427609 [Cercophora scortea]|uniref:Uncharacterized protein n=1 Tax=Cercophora scortea TaxID=314031 RepID=A0AAE0MA11_9PEZI|nr:hypothetical protein B0T19DRAFT_427609 [Cercophora scortea]
MHVAVQQPSGLPPHVLFRRLCYFSLLSCVDSQPIPWMSCGPDVDWDWEPSLLVCRLPGLQEEAANRCPRSGNVGSIAEEQTFKFNPPCSS